MKIDHTNVAIGLALAAAAAWAIFMMFALSKDFGNYGKLQARVSQLEADRDEVIRMQRAHLKVTERLVNRAVEEGK